MLQENKVIQVKEIPESKIKIPTHIFFKVYMFIDETSERNKK